MNIALIRRRFSPTGGAERYLLRLAGGLQERGCKITLYCEEWTSQESPFSAVKTVPGHSPQSFANAIQALHLRDQHDIVFSLERVPGCHIYRAGDGLHVEWLAHRHLFYPILGRIKSAIRAKNLGLCRLEAAVFDPKQTDRIICNSNFVANQITARFKFPLERMSIVPNGVPVEQFSQGDRELGRKALGLASTDFVVLLVGAGKERKGHAFAQTAISYCRNPVRLVIVDKPPGVPMQHIYAAADVFYLPTLYDPFANVILEALAAGLPVITSAQNGAAEILTNGQNGFILKWASDVRQAAKLIDDLADHSFRESFRAPAQALARQYDLSRNLTETLKVFDKLERNAAPKS